MCKMYPFYPILLCALFYSFCAQAQDLQLQNPNTFLHRMEDVAMHENGSGLAIGSPGLLLKTTDFGDTWAIHSESLNGTRRIAAIPGTDGQSFLLLLSNQIRISNDAGDTWTSATLLDPLEGGALSLRAVPSTAAMYAANNLLIYKSTDQGQNWSSVTPDLGEEVLRSLHFTTADIGWCSTDTGRIFQTTDGGETWQVVNESAFTEPTVVAFLNEDIGYACVFKDLYKTIDGGQSWSLQLANAFGSHQDQIEVIDEDRLVFSQGALVVYASDDGGQTVERFAALPYGYNYQHLCTLPDGRVWLACSYGSIAFSDNGGLNYVDQIPDVKYTFTNIDFLDANNGWAAGRGAMLRTQNGGDLWESVNMPPNPIEPEEYTVVNLLKPSSSQTAVIGTAYEVLETTDGGDSWNNLLSANNDERFREFASHDDHIWILSSDPFLYRSTDNGANWTSMATNPPTFVPYFMHFVNNNLGFLGGTSGTLWKTTDSGDTWTEVPDFSSDALGSMFFLNDTEGWLVPRSFANYVYHTTDGGDTWNPVEHGFNNFYNHFYAANDQEYYLFGGTSTQGRAIYSNDGGANWELLFTTNVAAFQDYARVDVTNGHYLWVCGAAGYIGRADFIETSTNAPGFEELMVFPNPSSGLIQLGLPWESSVTADYQLFNALGQLTAQGVIQQAQLDFSGLPKGNYCLIIGLENKTYRTLLVIN